MFELEVTPYVTTLIKNATKIPKIIQKKDEIYNLNIGTGDLVYCIEDGQFYIFTNDQYTTITENVSDGNVVVVDDENGSVEIYSKEYYDNMIDSIEDETTDSDDTDEEEVNDE